MSHATACRAHCSEYWHKRRRDCLLHEVKGTACLALKDCSVTIQSGPLSDFCTMVNVTVNGLYRRQGSVTHREWQSVASVYGRHVEDLARLALQRDICPQQRKEGLQGR